MILKATQRAFEKLKEIANGSKEKVNEFIDKIVKEGISKNEYSLFLKNSQQEFYYHKCKNVYVIFDITDSEVTFVDILTEVEFKEIKGNK